MKLEEFEFKRITYQSGGKELEELVLKPQGKGPFPAVVLVHGHNFNGGWENLLLSYFLVTAGYVAISPSQVGYGFSQGERDFCGPATVQGIIDGVTEVASLDYIGENRIGIWGISRGATVASQVITVNTDLFNAAVLQSGSYDIKKSFEHPGRPDEIKDAMIKETGGGDEEWLKRSSVLNAHKIKIPTLILHGEKDDRVNVEQAVLMDDKLTEFGIEHETVILKDEGHVITKQTRSKYTFPFLAKYLQK